MKITATFVLGILTGLMFQHIPRHPHHAHIRAADSP